jgi:hypothetical protein
VFANLPWRSRYMLIQIEDAFRRWRLSKVVILSEDNARRVSHRVDSTGIVPRYNRRGLE